MRRERRGAILAAMAGAYVVASSGWILVGVLLGLLCLAWLVALFAIVVDEISAGAKTLWLLAVTLLAPFAIPVYFIARHRRRANAAPRPTPTAAGW